MELALEAFRCFEKLELPLFDQTVLIGRNASGKTTILESIYVLFLGQSFRKTITTALINRAAAEAYIHLERDHRYTMKISRTGSRRIERDGKGERFDDRVGSLPVSLFAPEEFLFFIAPEYRRHALNRLLIQANPTYRTLLRDYGRLLRQRNLALKTRAGGPDRTFLASLDELLLPLAADIQAIRSRVILELSALFPRAVLSATYLPSRRTEGMIQRELIVGQTLSGPHRDDWRLSLRGEDVATIASRGEQRESLLHLAIAETAWLEMKLHRRPLLLLDDIVAEFDTTHRLELNALLKGRQYLLTSAELALLPPKLRRTSDILELESYVAKSRSDRTPEPAAPRRSDAA